MGRTVILFSRKGGGGGMGGYFPTKIPAQRKWLIEKIVRGGPRGKNPASAFYSPGPVFDCVLARAIAHQKRKHHAQLKGEKKNSFLRKLPNPLPHPQKSNGSSLIVYYSPIDHAYCP